MISTKRLFPFLLLMLGSVLIAQEPGGEVKRSLAVAWEQDHPQVVLLAQSLKASLVNLKRIKLVDDPEAGDAVLYVGRLELGSRDGLWVRGVDRYFGDEIFTETWIFQEFDSRALLDEFLPRVVAAVRSGFPPLDKGVAGIVSGQQKGKVVFPDPEADLQQPVTVLLQAPEGTRMLLPTGEITADNQGRLRIRALPGTLLTYRAEAPGYVPKSGELLVGEENETRLLEMDPYAVWALELKARVPDMGVIPGLVWYLLDEEIFLYGSLEQNMLSLKNIFSGWSDSSPGFLQPVVGMGGYSGAADALIRPYMGFGLVTRFVFGESRTIYLSKTMTGGIDFSLGLDIDPFEGEDLSIILNYTPRIFYSSFYDRPFEDYFPMENPPAHLEGNWHLQWAGPVNIGVRWEL